MDKIATLVKEAEVRGVLAGLADAGHIKIASAEELEAYTEAVSGLIGDSEYDLDTVLGKTAEVIEYLESGEGIEKEAEEASAGAVDETAAMAAFGELAMQKIAGALDDEAFQTAVGELAELSPEMAKVAAGFGWDGKADTASEGFGAKNKVKGRKLQDLKGLLKRRAAGEGVKDAAKGVNMKALAKLVRKGGGTAALYAPAVAAGIGAKALYNKYKKN